MKFKWVTKLDMLGKDCKQIQFSFPNKDTVHIYRVGNPVYEYRLLFPSFNIISIDASKSSVYIWENIIRDSKDEEDFIDRMLVDII